MLKEKLTFRYREPLEFIISMGMLACEEAMLKLAEDYKIQIDPLLKEFFDYAREHLSAHSLRELKVFFGHDFFHGSLNMCCYRLLAFRPEIDQVAELIEALKQENEESLVSGMVYDVYYDRMDEFLDGEQWDERSGDLPFLMERVKRQPPADSVATAREPLLECLSHPKEAKQRLLHLLMQVDQGAFEPWKDRFRAMSEPGLNRYKELFEENPAKFIREYEKLSPDFYIQENQTIVHVSFCLQVGNYYMAFGSEVGLYLFGLRNEEIFGTAATLEKVEQFFKAMSDNRRLKMISLLLKRPHYGTEIAEVLGITPAAVSYHANFLFFLDLIEMKRTDHRLYYHLRKERMSELLQMAGRVLLEE